MKNIVMVLLFSFLFLGCSNLNNITEKPLVMNSKEHSSLNDTKHYYANTGYKYYLKNDEGKTNSNIKIDERRKASIDNFVYALMSSNAYDDTAYFDLSEFNYKRITRYKAWNGFSADIYKNNEKNEIVIAFRGTENLWLLFFARDNLFANMSLGFDGQYESARLLVDKIKTEYPEFENFKVVGHSLGGGLAIHVALYKKGVEAVAFNASPRYFKKYQFEENRNKITLITEKGDVLTAFGRMYPKSKITNKDEVEYNFMKDWFEHNGYLIARGILKTAATAEYSNEIKYKNEDEKNKKKYPIYPDGKDSKALLLMRKYIGEDNSVIQ